MAEIDALNQMEKESIYLMREIEAEQKGLTIYCNSKEDRAQIQNISQKVFYPEKVNLSFFDKEVILEPEYTDLRPTGQERTLLYHTQKEVLMQKPQMWHLYNGETREKEILIVNPKMGFSKMSYDKKPICKMITCGGVDDGKSTLIGRLLYDSATEETKESIRRDEKLLRLDGTLDYALLSACTKEEAEQGITVSVSYSLFETSTRRFLMADTPGHEEYSRNMAYGASGASAAIIMIAADKGIVPQTKRHTRICSFMGIQRFIFAVNKMDLMDYSSQIFYQICDEVLDMMQEYPNCMIKLIPVAAKKGENIGGKTEHMRWYTGETLLETLENISVEEEKETEPLLWVQRICKSSQIEGRELKKRTILGEVSEGNLTEGANIVVYPSMEVAQIQNLHVLGEKCQRAKQHEPVSFELSRELDISRGCVLTGNVEIELEDYLDADILWMSDQRLKNGNRYIFKLGTKKIGATFIKMVYQTDVNTGEHLQREYLTKNMMARCQFSLNEKVPMAPAVLHESLGRFLLIDMESGETAGVGIIIRPGIAEQWELVAQEITEDKRESSLGQKAYVLLFLEGDGVCGMMNRMEERLLGMGLHTMQIKGSLQENILPQIQSLVEAGIIVLVSADKKQCNNILGQKIFENKRLFFETVKESAEDLGELLKQVRRKVING